MNIWQTQFLYSGSRGDGQWTIPVTLCYGEYNSCTSFLLEKKSETRDIKDLFSNTDKSSDPAHSWIKLNVDQVGFFRVKYGDDLAAKLGSAIENKYLSVADRLGNLNTFFFRTYI